MTAPDIEVLFREAGILSLTPLSPIPEMVEKLRNLVAKLDGADRLQRNTMRAMVLDLFKAAKVPGAARIVDAAFALDGNEFLAQTVAGTPQANGKELRVVSPPKKPMRVARELAKDLFEDSAELVLRDHRGDFYRYDGACWPELDGRLVRATTYSWLETAVYEKQTKDGTGLVPWDPTRHKITDVIDALRAVVVLEGEPPMWTDDAVHPPAREIIAMKNGLIHIPTRTLYPHTPQFFTHHALPFDFCHDAPAPDQWLAFLAQLWPNDSIAIMALQEVIGDVLGGDTRQQKIFLLVGPRRGGKGTIGRVVTGLLGAHNVAAPTLASLATNFGLQPLIGRPLALISDARLSGWADTKVVVERLLSISGQDSLTIDRKYKEPWTGRLSSRFLILTNELPRLADSSGALASRFVVFVLTESFLGREDPGLTDRLLAEASGIFNWALEGLDRLNARGYFEPPISGREAVEHLEDLASPVSAFIRESCIVGAEQQVRVDDLWKAWKAWCTDENRSSSSKVVFGRDLKAVVPTLHKARPRDDDSNRKMVYQGIGLRESEATLLDHYDHRDQNGHGHGGHSDRAMSSQFDEHPPKGPPADLDPSDDDDGVSDGSRGDAWEPE